MNVIDNIPFGLGYFDHTLNGIKEVNNIELLLNPFESKTYRFFIYGDKIGNNNLISVITDIESLSNSSKISISMFSDKGRKYWTTSDIQLSKEGVKIYPLLITISNTHYSELNTNLKINLSLQSTVGEKINNISYYGNMPEINGYKVLSRPIEVKSQRSLVIDPVPDGADYTYLSYSSGDTLILLDDHSAIPYKPTPAETVVSAAAMSLPDAGFYMWDDGEIIDWDTDITDSVETTNSIADDEGTRLTSDENIGYKSEDSTIEGE